LSVDFFEPHERFAVVPCLLAFPVDFTFESLCGESPAVHSAATQTSQQTVDVFKKYVIPNYVRYPVSLVHGEGSYVWDAEGKRYLDLFPGWGCNILGHCPPHVVEAVQKQVAHLIHIPNTWHTEGQGRFAQLLCERGFGQVFFCNSGAEAIEGAIKLARLTKHAEGKFKLITFENSFHGRTYAAVTATAQPKYHEGLGPMVPGFSYAKHNDLESVRRLIDAETCAIMVEPVQGEGGINIPTDEFIHGLRKLCDQHGMLLIFDEVQTCMGRTGTWFGYQQWGVQPDILTMAKGVCAGVACGVVMAKPEVAVHMKPGKHASTFGGNPLAMAAGIATIEAIEEGGLLEHVKLVSARFKSHFERLKERNPLIRELRVKGNMIGVDLKSPGGAAVGKCLERGVLINVTHDTVVRLLPALNITPEQVDEGCAVIADVLDEMAKGA
jgi:predicted acetylornithine/succinylornithine family transaminase